LVDLAAFEFLSAVLNKDMGAVVRLLRANYPLSAKDKCLLADLLEGKIKRARGARPWRATDELRSPEKAAVRRAAYFVELIKVADRRSGAAPRGRHERAVQQAFEYMKEKGFRLPNRESLENYLRRSRQPKAGAQH
jgi:hypothetical protein